MPSDEQRGTSEQAVAVDERAIANARGAVGAVRTASETVDGQLATIDERANSQADEIASVVHEVSDLSATIEEVAASTDQVATRSEDAAERAADGRLAATEAMEVIEAVRETSEELATEVEQLNDRIDTIETALAGIDDIAEQTNLLALNASIEAARADGNSEGFAVVADEIKSLASEAQSQADTIESALTGVQSAADETVAQLEATTAQIERGADHVADTMDEFDAVADVVSETADDVQSVSAATEDLADSSESIATSAEGVADRADDIGASIGEIRDARGEQTEMLREVEDALSTADVAERSRDRLSTGLPVDEHCGGLVEGGQHVLRSGEGVPVDDLLAREGGYHSINENVRKDGERIICEWHNRVVTDEDGEAVAIFSQFQDITERRTQQKELERHRAVIESASNTIITIDESGLVQSVNPAVEATFGYSPDELIGEPMTKLMGDAAAERHRSAFGRYLETGRKTLDWEYTELEGQHRDGSPVPVGVTFGEVEHEDALWFVGILRDVTEEKRQKQELEWTNAVLSTLLETLPVGVLAETDDREVLATNDRLFELFDLDGSPEAVGGDDCEALAEELGDRFPDPSGFVDRINEIVAANESLDGEDVALENGRTFARTHEPIELPDGKGHLWTYRDITAQRAYEDRLAALNGMAQDLIGAESREAAAEIGVEAARDVLELDANAVHLVDDERSALVPVAGTEQLSELIGEPPRLTEGNSIAWRVFERGEPLAVDDTHEETDVYNPDSRIRGELHLPLGEYGILVAGSPSSNAFDDEDIVLGEILAGSLVSAFEQIEQSEQRRARERELTVQNERLEEFASIVSHDLRNPLNVAEGRLELAQENGDWDQLTAVERAHDRMNAMIDDLLTLAREGEQVSEISPVALDEVAHGSWEHVVTDDATLEVASDRAVLADRGRLQQLLENLMRNAVEHAGDAVTVSIGETAGADGFYVEDDGPGIPPEVRENVFEAGYTTSDRGTGFGLRIVKQIVEAHDWAIEVRDGTDGGARFEITGVEFAAD